MNGASGQWTLMPGDLAAVPELRHLIMAMLDQRAPRGADLWSAEIVVAEMLSNAVLHAATPTTVELRWDDDHPLLSLTGEQPDQPAQSPAPMAESGRGLYLVSTLALGVSVAHTSHGEQVDVMLDVARSA